MLTPLGVGAGRPSPYISNLSLSLIVHLRLILDADQEAFARVKVPKEVLPRFVEIEKDTFIPLEDIIARHLGALFPGCRSSATTCSASPARPNSRSPTRPTTCSRPSRTSCAAAASGRSCGSRSAPAWNPPVTGLIEWLNVDEVQVYDVDGLLDLGDLWQIASIKDHPEIRWPNWTPVTAPGLVTAQADGDAQPDMFAMMRAGDVLVHYPYQSFTSSVERFVKQAVDDPNVLAIKMTVGKRFLIVHEAGQPLDHPVPAHFPEGRYLKFVLGAVDEV